MTTIPPDRNRVLKTCLGCGELRWIHRAAKGYCSLKCYAVNVRRKDVPSHYTNQHKRVSEARGKAAAHPCARCDRQAVHWANLTGNYGDIKDYEPMCASCHARFDAAIRPHGESHGCAKLTEADVLQIRARHTGRRGVSGKMLAAEYRVSITTISRIIRRKTWTHI